MQPFVPDRLRAALICGLVAGGLCSLAVPRAWADAAAQAPRAALEELASEFFDWRGAHQPVSREALYRVPRPPGWLPDWSPADLEARKLALMRFQARLRMISRAGFNVSDEVDAALLRAALERVHWELQVLALPNRDPGFYLDQSLGSVFELLVESPSVPEAVITEIIRRLDHFPAIINSAKLNLDGAVAPLAEAASERMGDVDGLTAGLEAALRALAPESMHEDIAHGCRAAGQALRSYQDWLELSKRRFGEDVSIGEARYLWYLGHVAMIPRSPAELLLEARLAAAQSGVWAVVERHRLPHRPIASRIESVERLAQATEVNGAEVRAFLSGSNLAAIPERLGSYRIAALPEPLAPVAAFGEAVHFALTGEEGAGAIRYVADGEAEHALVEMAWRDPRLLITWEGIPGHYAQLWLSSRHARPIRRHVLDASANQGIALYLQEQTLQAGLYAFSPGGRQLVLEWLRYQSALAEADIRLATGEWGLDEAVEFIGQQLKLSLEGARREALRLISRPGRASGALAARVHITRFLADAAEQLGEEFSLRDFNDSLLLNGNVPIALQRWEYLGREDELEKLVEQRGAPATVPQ